MKDLIAPLGVMIAVISAIIASMCGLNDCLEQQRTPQGTTVLLGRNGPCATYRVSAGPHGGSDATYTHCDGKTETQTATTMQDCHLVGKLMVCTPVDHTTITEESTK